ncbi:MAG: imidazoleglycerol-phosphate dehydratase HisB [Planctomycetota bacterium]|nr:imidazoleglycerol-phosphate dehydratase HisB [Planctomycetota bacterium]
MKRSATVERTTKETKIALTIGLDGTGVISTATGVGFLDHMLELFAKHGRFDLEVDAEGDLHVDGHHTVEDVGICLGQAVAKALGDKQGIRRYGSVTLPMDETLVTTAVDLGGRAYFEFRVDLPAEKIGDFDSELVREFCHAFAQNAHCNLHVLQHYGRNTHHIAEAVFKSLARALRVACEIDPRQTGVPSTKGTL